MQPAEIFFASNIRNCFINEKSNLSVIFAVEFHLYYRHWILSFYLEVQVDFLKIMNLWENSLWYDKDSKPLRSIIYELCGLFYVRKFPKCPFVISFNKPIQRSLKDSWATNFMFSVSKGKYLRWSVSVTDFEKGLWPLILTSPRFGNICTIQKTWKTPMDVCYFC